VAGRRSGGAGDCSHRPGAGCGDRGAVGVARRGRVDPGGPGAGLCARPRDRAGDPHVAHRGRGGLGGGGVAQGTHRAGAVAPGRHLRGGRNPGHPARQRHRQAPASAGSDDRLRGAHDRRRHPNVGRFRRHRHCLHRRRSRHQLASLRIAVHSRGLRGRPADRAVRCGRWFRHHSWCYCSGCTCPSRSAPPC
jgi:hypothetical protein